jgi:hypothetical protein
MTKKLEELLNLPEHQETLKTVEKEIKAQATVVAKTEEIEQTMREFDKVSQALPPVDGLGHTADKELDDLATKAEKAYDDLMDLGMNVETRYASRIFEVAGGMLRNALDAKIAKLDKKLKIVDLQLKKQKLDNDARGEDGNGQAIDVTGYVVTDRNSLIEKLKKMDK